METNWAIGGNKVPLPPPERKGEVTDAENKKIGDKREQIEIGERANGGLPRGDHRGTCRAREGYTPGYSFSF